MIVSLSTGVSGRGTDEGSTNLGVDVVCLGVAAGRSGDAMRARFF